MIRSRFDYDPWDEPESTPVFDQEEACRAAVNPVRNCDYAVFPCSQSKTPSRPKKDGGRGFHDASKDPDEIAQLWRRWPGPLIGVATGAVSGVA
jgi:hypothetical protein